MLNKNIINYLNSKNGNLGNETWYEVGLKFGVESPDKERADKDLDYKKKSIATKTNDIWRSFVKQKNNLELKKETYKEGELKFQTFGKPVEKIDQEIDLDEYEIDKFTTNPYGGAWVKHKKKENFHTESHLEELATILKKELVPVDYNLEEEIHSNKGLFVYTSDKHIGALTKEDSIYKNNYSKSEIKRRLVFNIISYIKESILNFGRLDSLYIMDLGDALDGFNAKTTGGLRGTSSHTLPQQMNNREQHDFYVEVHKLLFDMVVNAQLAKNIYFIATSNSNHGGDFEYGAMKHLETYLNIKYPFIKTCVNYYPLNHFIYGEHAIIFGHGKDSEDMKNGLPLNLTEKVEVYINDYINKNHLSKYNITVVTGDLHQSSENYGKNFRYKKVLSQYGSSKWMHTNFGSGSPGVSLEVINKDSKLIYKMDRFFEIKKESNTGIDFGR